jgi:hypothetical protein
LEFVMLIDQMDVQSLLDTANSVPAQQVLIASCLFVSSKVYVSVKLWLASEALRANPKNGALPAAVPSMPWETVRVVVATTCDARALAERPAATNQAMTGENAKPT